MSDPLSTYKSSFIVVEKSLTIPVLISVFTRITCAKFLNTLFSAEFSICGKLYVGHNFRFYLNGRNMGIGKLVVVSSASGGYRGTEDGWSVLRVRYGGYKMWSVSATRRRRFLNP